MSESLEVGEWEKILLKLTIFVKDLLPELNEELFAKICFEGKNRAVAEWFLNNVKKSHLKDSSLALKKKEEGNKKFNNKEYEKSLSLYTESIFYAAKDDECLPLAYSNRSMVLERMGHFLESITDIDLALECGYPKQKEEILILRKARCLLQLGDCEKARKILTEALKNCERKEYQKLIENELQKTKDNKSKKTSSKFQLPELVGGENENFPSASKYLSVHYDERRGRHVIANQDIKQGDVLFVEKPFVFKAFDQFCDNCSKSSVAPIPCWSCRGVYYCSPKCRDYCWNSFHSFECGFTEFLKSLGIAHTSIRIILKASSSFDELKKILSSISEPVYENGNVVHISMGYEALYNLVHNRERFKKTDLFQYLMTALLLALYLKNHTKYFPPESNEEDLILLTHVIMRHILQLICSGFTITKISANIRSENITWTVRQADKFIGVGIYTSASMMNHSCQPSTWRNFYQTYMIVSANKLIKKGEEVFISYGPEASIMKKDERQKILTNQYFFNCECQMCLLPYDIQDKFTAFKCSKCKGPSVTNKESSQTTICLSCGENSEITPDIALKHKEFYSLMEEGKSLSYDCTISLEKYLRAWRIGREIFYKFHRDVTNAADEIAGILLELREFRKSIRFLKCCIRSREEQFGDLSFEVTRDLKKVADIISLYLIHNKTAEDAKDLALEGLHYYEKIKAVSKVNPEFEIPKNIDIELRLLQDFLEK